MYSINNNKKGIEIDEFEDKLNVKDILLNQRQSSLLFCCEYLRKWESR